MNQNNENKSFCSWCRQPTEVIWVHGHGQCKHCGINIDECCRGEICASLKSNPIENQTVSKKSKRKN